MFMDSFGSGGPALGTMGKSLVLMCEDAVEENVRTLNELTIFARKTRRANIGLRKRRKLRGNLR